MIFPDFSFEQSLIPKNTRFLLGIDEVGRGPWAGPVAIGAFLFDLVNFDLDFFIKNKIRDSKTLSSSQRQKIKKLFESQNYSYSVTFSDSQVIDNIGLSKAITLAVSKSLAYFSCIDYVLVDGSINLPGKFPHRCLNRGDQSCFSIAAASIVAKVARDEQMVAYDSLYPGYYFSHHKGYGTRLHQQSLLKLGPCPIHRRSFKPIKKILKINTANNFSAHNHPSGSCTRA